MTGETLSGNSPKIPIDGAELSHDVTRILNAFQEGRLDSTNALIPVVYNELRQIAAHRLNLELPGQTLQATALVHEAYLRLINPEIQSWQNRRHFFGAAAEAMRRILIENARRKQALKRGGAPEKADIDVDKLPVQPTSVDLLDLNAALEDLEKIDPEAAELVKLRHFAGFTRIQIARILGVSPRSVDRIWVFAKAWLYRRLNDDGERMNASSNEVTPQPDDTNNQKALTTTPHPKES